MAQLIALSLVTFVVGVRTKGVSYEMLALGRSSTTIVCPVVNVEVELVELLAICSFQYQESPSSCEWPPPLVDLTTVRSDTTVKVLVSESTLILPTASVAVALTVCGPSLKDEP